MTEEEIDQVELKQNTYYFEHWHRIFLQMLHYKNPAVASAGNYSLLTFNSYKFQPIYFHVAFVKPGKSTYIVEHRPHV